MKFEHGRAALISVFDKTGIEDFARILYGWGWDILASGGTAKYLAEHGVPVHDVANLVGGGAILGHRVVTLSREIHAGLLARRTDEDRAELKRLGIPWIGLACVDLYPLEAAINAEDTSDDSVIESTDIGGPTILRSAAKGRRIVISQPNQREMVLEWMRYGCRGHDMMINYLAAEAERVCAEYALRSAEYWSRGQITGLIGCQQTRLKYGENPWQTPAALFSAESSDPLAVPNFEQIQGAPMGYCNYTDLDRLLTTATLLAATISKNGISIPKIAVGVKHGNPCGASYDGSDACETARRMLQGDPRAIFGGAVLVNYGLTIPRTRNLFTHGMPAGKTRKLDLVVAPDVSKSAREYLRNINVRVLVNRGLFDLNAARDLDHTRRIRPVRGGMLVQPANDFVLDFSEPQLETHGRELSDLVPDMALAWAIGSTTTSNTVCLVKNGQLIGNGCGQQDRVTACKHTIEKAREAGHNTKDAVAYSDSFFPFIDGPELLVKAGVKAVLTCSGSVNDRKVFDFFCDNGVTVYAIPHKIARGFFGH